MESYCYSVNLVTIENYIADSTDTLSRMHRRNYRVCRVCLGTPKMLKIITPRTFKRPSKNLAFYKILNLRTRITVLGLRSSFITICAYIGELNYSETIRLDLNVQLDIRIFCSWCI